MFAPRFGRLTREDQTLDGSFCLRPIRFSFAGVRVLLVEDDMDVREATEALLQAECMSVTSCADAARALEHLGSQYPFDVLVSDIVLGGELSGLDVVDVARRLRPTLPVIVTTGYAASRNGIVRQIPKDVLLLLKPFRRVDLLGAIDSYLPAVRSEAA